jgi:hypothetical protein
MDVPDTEVIAHGPREGLGDLLPVRVEIGQHQQHQLALAAVLEPAPEVIPGLEGRVPAADGERDEELSSHGPDEAKMCPRTVAGVGDL